jgi:uncharacterized membrane protein
VKASKIKGALPLSLLAAIVAAAACGHPSEQQACPALVQNDCPAAASTFNAGIGELLHARCYPCHASDGVERSRQLTDYSHVFGERMSIALQLQSCAMPPLGSPQLTSSERQQILDWFACGAPE